MMRPTLVAISIDERPPMFPILIDGPALEPLSLAEARAWLKIDGTDEDELVRALIVAARLMVEADIRQVLIGQNWRLVGDDWPRGETIPVRIGRVIAATGARVYAANGTPSAIPASSITVYRNRDPHEVAVAQQPAPGRAKAGVEIDIRLGFGEAASDVPEVIRTAIRRLIALWYENRGDAGDAEMGLPPQIRALLRPFRRARL